MTAHERLRAAVDRQQARLRAAVPADRPAAVLALLRARDGLPRSPGHEAVPDLVTGRRLDDPGGNRALALCLAADGGAGGGGDTDLDAWSTHFLDACGRLAKAELVLAHAEMGFMLLVGEQDHRFDAWIATKRPPTTWRERADVDWWAGWLARRHEPELHALEAQRPTPEAGDAEQDAYYRRLAGVRLETMAYQLGYPSDAALDGCTVQTYRDVLGRLLARALRARDRHEAPSPCSESALVAEIASALGCDPAVVGRAVAAFTVDRESAAYHAAVPGVAAAPLVRIGPDQVVLSVSGLTTEPLLFLTRELRRRAAQAYHNSAFLREGVFRQDLHALFGDRRFVTSAGRIELRRAAGDVRTDVDAVIFDRKSGTLALFELKSQDPFARSTAELLRQRDNVLYANRQVSGVRTWLQRHGPNELLARVDARTAKTFRAQKVYPFVLGRYLAHFGDGPEPDRRAAWGTWPQILRLLDAQPIRATDTNPIASLFARLTKDVPRVGPPAADEPSREIDLGEARLVVHPAYAAFQARAAPSSGRR